MAGKQKVVFRKRPPNTIEGETETYVVEQLVNRVEPTVGSTMDKKNLKDFLETNRRTVDIVVNDSKG